MPGPTERRKTDHIHICMEKNVQARQATTGFEDTFLVHKALPEIDRDKIDLSTRIFNHTLSAPLIVEAMTGGATETTRINAAIAEAVEEMGLGMGVGSQRAAIENPKLIKTFAVARKTAPTAFLMANIGAPQLAKGYNINQAGKAVEMIDADALAVHLNPLQEAIQPEGEAHYFGVLEKIKEVTEVLDIPVVAKETGSGIAAEEAKMLETAGVGGIDVAGTGGTSWAAVEYHRAKKIHDKFREKLGEDFWDWGIPTVASLIEVIQSVDVDVIASGGVRSGIDIAKSLALGANLTGIASPILRPAANGSSKVKKALQFVVEELRSTMFLVGAESAQKLKQAPVVLSGKTAEWLRVRGFQPEQYARRRKDD
ncbi:MAG: type 2 isopentenyl-diphosphate Delta-isomerase [Candidatus Bathyarchaeota archaeon]|nr:MAG: type 2 isopentenyl-diphosphate Delta-isomerase [Candidatus Bathyarchaeota archaeon]